MPLRILNGTVIVTAVNVDAITAADNEQIIITANGLYAAEGALGSGIDLGTGSIGNLGILVQGSLYGANRGIDLDTAAGDNHVTVAATGTVVGTASNAVHVDGSNASFTNLGNILSFGTGYTVYSGATNTLIVNSGSITSNGTAAPISTVSTGGTTIVNTGLINAAGFGGSSDTYGAIYLQSAIANDTVWNSGTIIGGIALGGGNDLYQGTGRVQGNIGSTTSGGGNDTLIGSGFDDTIIDVEGGNWLVGGDGADTVTIGNSIADGQVDFAFGGVSGGADTSANDRLVMWTESGGGGGVNIFLNNGYVGNAANTAVVAYIAGFEHATGTGAVDAIFGSAGANIIDGEGGNDWMVGNGGADTFRFSLAAHAVGDQVRDLRRSEGDRIDLRGIDASSATTVDDAFVFRTTHTSNTAGEAVITNYGASARVDLYVNADNVSDGFFFVVYGDAGMTNLQAGDLLL